MNLLVIVHAGSENGLVPGAHLSFTPQKTVIITVKLIIIITKNGSKKNSFLACLQQLLSLLTMRRTTT